MLFKDLMSIEYDRSHNILMEKLNKILENTPESVKKQVYSDHGRKGSFQKIYKEINIENLIREEKEFFAKDIIKCGYNPNFELLNTDLQNYNYTDTNSDIRKNRDEKKTRMMSPVFINSSILGNDDGLRLVEGHNRTGTLKGLVERGIISPNSKHKVFYGEY